LTASFTYWNNDKPCGAVVEHLKERGLDVFQGFFVNYKDKTFEGRYTLEAIREGVSGSSVSHQGGEFKVAGKSRVKLSRTSINIDEKDTYKVVLNIYDNDELLCADSIVVGGMP